MGSVPEVPERGAAQRGDVMLHSISLTDAEISRALAHNVAYQGLLRGSMRMTGCAARSTASSLIAPPRPAANFPAARCASYRTHRNAPAANGWAREEGR
jgi:hypothetical protein